MGWFDVVAIWLLLGSVLGGGIFLVVYLFVYNIKVRVREKTSTYDAIIDKRGRIARDREDGIDKLHIFQYKVKRTPCPPPEAIGLTKKGKQVLELEVNQDGFVRYIVKNTALGRFEAWNSNDQLFYINEQKKADARKKKTLGEILLQIAPLMAIVIMFVCLLIFWNDVMSPFTSRMNAAEQNYLEISENFLQTSTMLKEIIKQEQVISSVEGSEPVVVDSPSTSPPD